MQLSQQDGFDLIGLVVGVSVTLQTQVCGEIDQSLAPRNRLPIENGHELKTQDWVLGRQVRRPLRPVDPEAAPTDSLAGVRGIERVARVRDLAIEFVEEVEAQAKVP